MTSAKLILLFLLAASNAMAQDVSTNFSVSIETSQDGHAEVFLRNRTNTDIGAFRITFKCPTFESTYIDDNALKGIEPHLVHANQLFRLTMTAGITANCKIIDSAVAFTDGTTSGDAAAIEALKEERAAAADELDASSGILLRASNREIDDPTLRELLTQRRDQIAGDQSLSRAARQGHLCVLEELDYRIQSPRNRSAIERAGNATEPPNEPSARALEILQQMGKWSSSLGVGLNRR